MFRSILLTAAVAAVAFVGGFAISHFHLAGPVAARLRAMMPEGYYCGTEMLDGVCLGGSSVITTPHEVTIRRNLPSPAPATVVSTIDDFGGYLRRAVGWENIPGSTIECAPYTGAVQECFARFGELLDAQFLFQDGDTARPLVIILHGHVGAADKVMGLQPADYMREMGQVFGGEGYAVAALDLTHGAEASARLNGQLVLHGIQLYGLWSRFACDVARNFEDRDVVVYGLSNGGVIADHLSVLCDAKNISLVFVDDILTDWRSAFYKHPTIHAQQNYGLHYFAPLHHDTSYLHFVVESRFRKVYTRNEAALPDSLPRNCLLDGPSEKWQTLVSSLVIDHHVAQIELLREVLETGRLRQAQILDLECAEDALEPRPALPKATAVSDTPP